MRRFFRVMQLWPILFCSVGIIVFGGWGATRGLIWLFGYLEQAVGKEWGSVLMIAFILMLFSILGSILITFGEADDY